jgi:thiol-disulfide isomerase/thioredoxin
MPFKELTAKQFADLLDTDAGRRGEKYTVMFRADWCGYCKQALPEYKSAAKHSNNMFYAIEEQELNKYQDKTGVNLSITGFPTFFHHPAVSATSPAAHVSKYTGPRTMQAMLKAFG